MISSNGTDLRNYGGQDGIPEARKLGAEILGISESEVISLDKMVNDPYVSVDEKTFMHFALGKAYEDLNEYEKSFNHYKEGNLIKKSKALFNVNDFEIFRNTAILQKAYFSENKS